MNRRIPAALFCLCVLTTAAWLAREAPASRQLNAWKEVIPGVLRSPSLPAGYALVSGDKALLIDAPCGADVLQAHGFKQIDTVLLTHHHRDIAAFAGRYLASGAAVRAPKASAEWLTPDGVRKYWKESLPLRGSRTAYLVLPE